MVLVHRRKKIRNNYIKKPEANLISGFGNDYSTEIPFNLINSAKNIFLENYQEYNISELKGFLIHGIQKKIQVLMGILKHNKIFSQRNLPNNKISQLTIYNDYKQESRISTSVIGIGCTYKVYGQKGISFISNKLQVYKSHSHFPFEWFINEYISLDDLIITIDKDFALQDISSLVCDDILNKYRTNNEEIRDEIIKFLQEESELLATEIIDTNDKFHKYYHDCLKYIINPVEYKINYTIKDLVISLINKYESPIKLIIMNYSELYI
jgi:hypothetical protein